jgi:hypothetical protein
MTVLKTLVDVAVSCTEKQPTSENRKQEIDERS